MKPIVCEEYEPPDVLRLRKAEKPTPGDNEVLVKIHATSINSYDMRHLKADPFLIRSAAGLARSITNILGVDVAGVVESVGRNVTKFQSGNEVFGDTCECDCGGFAEYVSVDENVVVLKPPGMTFTEATGIDR